MTGACCYSDIVKSGRPNCVDLFGVTNGFLFAQWRSDAGVINGITAGTEITQSFVEGKLNNSDDSLAWFMSPQTKNAVFERTEDKTEEAEGYPVRTGEFGPGTWTFELWGKESSEAMMKWIDSMKCKDMGFMRTSKQRQLGGTNTGDGNLKFTKIQNDTLRYVPVHSSDGVVQKLIVMFTVDETELDSDFDWIPSSEFEYPVNYWYNSQPLQVKITEVSNNGVDEIVVTLDWSSNKYSDSNQLDGFVTADFTAFNITDSANITVTVVETETSTNGVTGYQYTISLDTGTNDDDMVRVGIDVDGFAAEDIIVDMSTGS